MIQEIGKSETKTKKKISQENSFGKNLQKAFNQRSTNCDEKSDKGADIKIRIEETFLTEVKTKKL